MIWQDVVVSVANLLFIYSLFHQVYEGFKNKKGYVVWQTSFFTCIGLTGMAISFFTLKLYLSSIALGLSSSLWLILLIQRLVYKKA